MAIEIRPIVTDEELQEFSRCQSIAFGWPEQQISIEARRRLFEAERSTAAFDDGAIVGTVGVYSYQMTVPGERAVPCAGVTMVSVMPSHRRQGILTQMMRDQLDRAKAQGDVIAALWASEAIIYGRFGYGLAADSAFWEIDRAFAELAASPPARGRVRYTSPSEALESWPAIYDAVRLTRPGWTTRTNNWWSDVVLADRPEQRPAGLSEKRLVQYEVKGEIQGYLRYRKKPGVVDRLHTGSTVVEELVALTDEAYAALWQFAFGIDLAAKIEAGHRPLDEPLRYMLKDSRRMQRRPVDSLWVRILDVERALGARAYASAGELVLDIADPFMPGVGGRFLLSASESGAICERTERPADLSLTISELGAVYLSGVSFSTLAQAGIVSGSKEAIARADAMFAWPVAPWIQEMF